MTIEIHQYSSGIRGTGDPSRGQKARCNVDIVGAAAIPRCAKFGRMKGLRG